MPTWHWLWALPGAHYRLNNNTEGTLHTGRICDYTLYQFEILLLSKLFCNVQSDLQTLIAITCGYQDNLELDWSILYMCVCGGGWGGDSWNVECVPGGMKCIGVFEGVWKSVLEGYVWSGHTGVCFEGVYMYVYRCSALESVYMQSNNKGTVTSGSTLELSSTKCVRVQVLTFSISSSQ